MKKILAILILSNVNWGFSQLNLDSIMAQLTNPEKFTKLGYCEPYTLRSSFLQFQSIDKKIMYEVNFDSTSKISECLGVALIYKTFDSEGRITKQIGYRLD